MIELDGNTLNELVALLRPFMENEQDRHGFLALALGANEPVLRRITWGGNVETFTTTMVCQLADYGEVESGRPALFVLLDCVRQRVGKEQPARIDQLIAQLSSLIIVPPEHKAYVQPHQDNERLLATLRVRLKQDPIFEGTDTYSASLVYDEFDSTTYPKELQIIPYGNGHEGEIRIPYDCTVTKRHYIRGIKARTATRPEQYPGIVTAKYSIDQNGIIHIYEIKPEIAQHRRCGNSIRDRLKEINGKNLT